MQILDVISVAIHDSLDGSKAMVGEAGISNVRWEQEIWAGTIIHRPTYPGEDGEAFQPGHLSAEDGVGARSSPCYQQGLPGRLPLSRAVWL